MRRLVMVLLFALGIGSGTVIAVAQDPGQAPNTEAGAPEAGCATPLASPGATPEATPFTTGEGLAGSTPVGSPVDLTGCPTPEVGTPAS